MRRRTADSKQALPAALAGVALLASGAGGAASLTLNVSPRSLEVGEAAALVVELAGARAPGTPELKLPAGVQAGEPHVSHMTRSANFVTTTSVRYQYRIVFAGAGTYRLGPATIRTDKGTLATGQVTVAVGVRGVAVIAELRPARVYTGQAVVATYVFAVSRKYTAYEMTVPFLKDRQGLRVFDPDDLAERWNEAANRRLGGLPGYAVRDVAKPRMQVVAKEEQREIDGVPHTAYVVRRVIVPQEPGVYDFGPARAGANIVVGRIRSRSRFPRSPFGDDLFDDFFSDSLLSRDRYRTKTVFATSEPLRLEVLPPPEEGRPAGFEGAIGRYEIEARVSPRETTLGGPPFELTLTVKGEGNIETVGAPRLPESPDFRLGVPEQEQKSRFEGGKLLGEKRFTIPLRPSSARLKEIPKARLVTFDPFDEKYVTVTTEPIPVTVTVPEGSGAPEVAADIFRAEEVKARRRTRDVVREDIEDIETEVDAAESHEAWLHTGTGIVVFGLLPACAYAALAVYAGRLRRLREDETFARRVSAERTARAKLKELYAETASLGTAEFAQGLSRALQGYLADALGRPSGEIPPAEAEVLLRDAGVPEARAGEFASLLAEAEAARFGGGEVDREDWLERAWKCVDAVQRGGAG